jgi:hypothetical protein
VEITSRLRLRALPRKIDAKGMQMILKRQVFSADSSVEKSKKG